MSNVKFKQPTIKKRKRTHKLGYVYTKNYKCFFLFLPLIPLILFTDWLNSKYYNSLKYSPERYTKTIDKKDHYSTIVIFKKIEN